MQSGGGRHRLTCSASVFVGLPISLSGMPTIALATYASLPKLYPDEHPLIEALVSLGVNAVPAVWDDPSVEWARFDGVIICASLDRRKEQCSC